MLESQKHVFWQAFLVTVLIFSLGIILGVILENWRTNKVDYLFEKSEIDLLDIKLQNELYSKGFFNCDAAIRENILFADRIFEEAKILDRYESASELKDDLILRHKKYDILRAMLLTNSIIIKENCNNSYYEVVYFYNYLNTDIDLKMKQNVFSRLLEEIKERKGKEVLLIPIAGNINSSAINLLLDKYNVTKSELPVLLINKKIKINEIENIEEIMEYFKG